MDDKISPTQPSQFFEGLKNIFVGILWILPSFYGAVAHYEIVVPPIADTKKPAEGVLAHDEKEEPPDDDVEIVIKPFRKGGFFAQP